MRTVGAPPLAGYPAQKKTTPPAPKKSLASVVNRSPSPPMVIKRSSSPVVVHEKVPKVGSARGDSRSDLRVPTTVEAQRSNVVSSPIVRAVDATEFSVIRSALRSTPHISLVSASSSPLTSARTSPLSSTRTSLARTARPWAWQQSPSVPQPLTHRVYSSSALLNSSSSPSSPVLTDSLRSADYPRSMTVAPNRQTTRLGSASPPATPLLELGRIGRTVEPSTSAPAKNKHVSFNSRSGMYTMVDGRKDDADRRVPSQDQNNIPEEDRNESNASLLTKEGMPNISCPPTHEVIKMVDSRVQEVQEVLRLGKAAIQNTGSGSKGSVASSLQEAGPSDALIKRLALVTDMILGLDLKGDDDAQRSLGSCISPQSSFHTALSDAGTPYGKGSFIVEERNSRDARGQQEQIDSLQRQLRAERQEHQKTQQQLQLLTAEVAELRNQMHNSSAMSGGDSVGNVSDLGFVDNFTRIMSK